MFASEIPIISAIGHETDYTIADFVADLRAPTPSAAAELAVPVKNELLQKLKSISENLAYRMTNTIDRLEIALRDLSSRLVDPRKQIEDWRLRIDDYSSRLIRYMQMLLSRQEERFQWWQDRLVNNSPARQFQNLKVLVEQNKFNLLKYFNNYLDSKSACLREITVQLETLSPVAILNRGYSITRALPDLNVVVDPKTVAIGQEIQVILAKGTLNCRIKGKSENGPKNI